MYLNQILHTIQDNMETVVTDIVAGIYLKCTEIYCNKSSGSLSDRMTWSGAVAAALMSNINCFRF